jgi:hypothetical protein
LTEKAAILSRNALRNRRNRFVLLLNMEPAIMGIPNESVGNDSEKANDGQVTSVSDGMLTPAGRGTAELPVPRYWYLKCCSPT